MKCMGIWKSSSQKIEKRDGGKNKLSNIIILCPNHHRHVHEGRIFVEGYSNKYIPGGYYG